MDHSSIRAYLASLARQLRARGIHDPRILEEAQGHLLESIEHWLEKGLSAEQAQQRALETFGSPEIIAAEFERERNTMLQKLLYIAAPCLGLLIAFVDSRPTWDDTGITALALLTASGLLGLLSPKRPWLWALAVGVWIPLYGILRTQDLTMLLVLVFPFAGAYAGTACRLVLQKVLHPA